ncbi:MAG: hypothetical protein KKE30_11160 [Gammaproteobacteria bacterium]|nr:hypothetical protein [Gammaproteobacteria bacterium]MBU1553962.1 hypothetical protein [Gammaproteobacteria bacterium]MBU2069533.1 hypothetical protein [Gammaproteobacteria bacterium]MBU2183079.1 hypothetical protein [Gammaproteobacteria bacterium]MBU2203093.1 hypothetical protein [Gammaproteobacteria bacterium]
MPRLLALLFILVTSHSALAHPTGSMVVIDGTVLWSYVCPVGSPDHRGCVMSWDEEMGARPWLISSFAASDWMMAPAADGKVYLVERYFDHARQTNRTRLLIASVGATPEELLPWFDDPHRFGEAGFAAIAGGRFLFARYPNLYLLNENGSASKWLEWPVAVFGVRQVQGGLLLIRGESEAWLTTQDGRILTGWSKLLQELTSEPPFMGNRVFDADYEDGSLWIAYWGKRRFEVIREGARTVVKSFDKPWLPHAVAADGGAVFMLASTIAAGDDQGIRPNLWRMKNNALELLWGEHSGNVGSACANTDNSAALPERCLDYSLNLN